MKFYFVMCVLCIFSKHLYVGHLDLHLTPFVYNDASSLTPRIFYIFGLFQCNTSVVVLIVKYDMVLICKLCAHLMYVFIYLVKSG